MSRPFFPWFVAVSVTATVAGCNGATCGRGTKQVQAANGDVECVLADNPATGDVPCDVDGGSAVIENGVCVSRVMCDPATTTYDATTGLCESNGMGGQLPALPVDAGRRAHVCITGRRHRLRQPART